MVIRHHHGISALHDHGSSRNVPSTASWMGRGDDYVAPIYVTHPFVQRGHGIGSFLSGLFRAVRLVLWSGAKVFGKATLRALGNEALPTGRKILMGIADNSTVSDHEIISKNETESLQNLSSKMRGQGQKRKRRGGLYHIAAENLSGPNVHPHC